MSAFFELVLFMAGLFFLCALIGRVCKEGGWDDFDDFDDDFDDY